MPKTQDMNLIKLVDQFHSEDRCRKYLETLRWPDGVACLRCGSVKISRSHKRNQFICEDCKYNFSVTAGTILHDTHLPLNKWFMAAYLMIESKKGISANQLSRKLDTSYKTAWYLSHRIRAAVADASPIKLKGIVEMDETFVGGEVRGKGHGYKGNKAIVVGAVQREGKIILQVVPDRSRKTLHAFAGETVHDDSEAIYTDDWRPYRGIGDDDTRHETVNHSIKEYVRGNVHTNSVEGVWSLLKRSIIGSFHKVSIKHLDAYLDELEWRFNNRDNPFLFRDTLIRLLQSEALEYKALTA
ncbi:MAG: IS1595 family transposase [SAR202 cluster bacterium]|nr:IS1595 family transposase [SAR202 cluster bacterium]